MEQAKGNDVTGQERAPGAWEVGGFYHSHNRHLLEHQVHVPAPGPERGHRGSLRIGPTPLSKGG